MALTLYTDDATDDGQSDELLADGVVHFNQTENCWVATIDWQAIRHASTEGKLQRKIGSAVILKFRMALFLLFLKTPIKLPADSRLLFPSRV